MFSPPSLPSEPIRLPLDEGDDEPRPPKRWTRRRTRVCIDLVHLLVAILLLASVIVGFIVLVDLAWGLAALWLIYLLPPIIFTIPLEIFHLAHGYTPVWIAKRFGRLLRLGSRAILYLVMAFLVMAVATLRDPRCWWCSDNKPTILVVIGTIVVGDGVLLLILAWAAEGCGFTDWVEEPVGKKDELLPNSDSTLVVQEESARTSGA